MQVIGHLMQSTVLRRNSVKEVLAITRGGNALVRLHNSCDPVIIRRNMFNALNSRYDVEYEGIIKFNKDLGYNFFYILKF